MNNLELRSQRGANVGEIAAGVLRNEMRLPSSSPLLMANPLTRTDGQLLFTWCLAEVALEDLNSCDKMKYWDKILHVNQIMMQHVASCST